MLHIQGRCFGQIVSCRARLLTPASKLSGSVPQAASLERHGQLIHHLQPCMLLCWGIQWLCTATGRSSLVACNTCMMIQMKQQVRDIGLTHYALVWTHLA